MADPKETARIQQEYQWLYPMIFATIALIIGISLGAWFFTGDYPILTGNLLHYVSGLWTQALSIASTVVILDRVNQWRDKQHRFRNLQENLLREARSLNNTVAVQAINELRNRNWLAGETGVLQGSNLERANLESVDFADTNLSEAELSYTNLQDARLTFANLNQAKLYEANLYSANLGYAELQEAHLSKANLQEADLIGANLKSANMMQVDLRKADLEYANLQNVILAHSNLEGAYLEESNLEGAILVNAYLKGADLSGTVFSTATALPDAEYSNRDNKGNMLFDKYWTSETDMSRYTNPEHPDFWQPKWVED